MRYFHAEEAREQQNAAFRLYIGTGIQHAVANIANAFGGSVLMDYAEYIGLTHKDTRSAEEIVDDVITRLGLVIE